MILSVWYNIDKGKQKIEECEMNNGLCNVDGNLYMSTKEAAGLWSVGRRTVTKYCADGLVPNASKDTSGRYIIPTAPLNTAVDICECKRKYFFPDGSRVVLYNLTEIVVRPSGSHRIKTADGRLHIVAAGWLHIEIEAEGGWAF